ncbi:MAG: hypothetical protein TREMPRED_002029 [Tremellales sp. Tagirdzhanova-0007]|nr:MAG: hypothetical protein TREMPRED_002029 [Tremellales sp. Tagirdzhanova-0007]
MSTSPSLSREQLQADISHLLTLTPTTLSSLLNPDISTPFPPQPISASSTSTAGSPPASAIQILDTFTPSSSLVTASQDLIKAYIRDMRGDILRTHEVGLDGERLGGRIDVVREKAEGVVDALEGVRV